MKNIISSFVKEFIKVVIIVAIAVPTIALFAAWTGPTGAPPTNNAAAPVNVGANDQIKKYEIDGLGNLIPGKSGGLVVGAFFSRFGTLLATNSDNVGIGQKDWVANPPTEKLEVVGGIKVGDTVNNNEGTIKYNNTIKDFEGLTSTGWESLTKKTTIPATTILDADYIDIIGEFHKTYSKSVTLTKDGVIIMTSYMKNKDRGGGAQENIKLSGFIGGQICASDQDDSAIAMFPFHHVSITCIKPVVAGTYLIGVNAYGPSGDIIDSFNFQYIIFGK